MEREPLLDDIADDSPPWTTGPGDLGSAECGWCHRAIYLPALPCSVRPVTGLAAMETVPGQGKRCQWELQTRQGAVGQAVAPLAPSVRWAAEQGNGA